jgi:hypothetical protein
LQLQLTSSDCEGGIAAQNRLAAGRAIKFGTIYRLFEIARVLVRLDHVARFMVNANHSAASDLQAIGEDPEKFRGVSKRGGGGGAEIKRERERSSTSTRAPSYMKTMNSLLL